MWYHMKDDKIGFLKMSFNIEDILNAFKHDSLNFKFPRANDFMTVSLLIVFAQPCVNEKVCDWYQIKDEKICFPSMYDLIYISLIKI